MNQLTTRQAQILQFIEDQITRTGVPPTRAEIASALGFRSINASEDHLQALARKGVISLTRRTSRGIRLTQNEANIASLNPETLVLPLIGKVAAGLPILAQEQVESTYQVDPAFFSSPPEFLLRAHGLSMRDAGILDGDLLAIRKASVARNGQIVVARIFDEVTVKRFVRNAQNITLLAENPDFKPIVISNQTNDFFLEGIVVGMIRMYS